MCLIIIIIIIHWWDHISNVEVLQRSGYANSQRHPTSPSHVPIRSRRTLGPGSSSEYYPTMHLMANNHEGRKPSGPSSLHLAQPCLAGCQCHSAVNSMESLDCMQPGVMKWRNGSSGLRHDDKDDDQKLFSSITGNRHPLRHPLLVVTSYWNFIILLSHGHYQVISQKDQSSSWKKRNHKCGRYSRLVAASATLT